MKYIFLFLSITSLTTLSSQDMAFYADVMINAEVAGNRTYAAKQFEILFDDAIKLADSFEDTYEELPFIFVRYADDRSFRTITWQIDRGDGDFTYDGYLQMANGDITRLAGKRGKSALSERGDVVWSSWGGGIIYKVLSFNTSAGTNHYLLTYRQLDQYTKAKTFESITFDKNSIVLGKAAIFENEGGADQRILLQYSADSNCNLRYEEESNQLVLDNLIPVGGRMEGQGPTLVPDGSYKAYELQQNGSWKYIDKLFNQTFTSPPRGGISSEGKDLFGKPKKNK